MEPLVTGLVEPLGPLMQGLLETPGLTVAGHLVHGQVKEAPYFDGRHEMENMREKSSIQLAFSKRQKTDLSSLEFELNRYKFV